MAIADFFPKYTAPTSQDRAELAAHRVKGYTKVKLTSKRGKLHLVTRDDIVDLLGDMMHLCFIQKADQHGDDLDFNRAIASAQDHFKCEIAEERDNAPGIYTPEQVNRKFRCGICGHVDDMAAWDAACRRMYDRDEIVSVGDQQHELYTELKYVCPTCGHEPRGSEITEVTEESMAKMTVGTHFMVHGCVMLQGLDEGEYTVMKMDDLWGIGTYTMRRKRCRQTVRHLIPDVDLWMGHPANLNRIEIIQESQATAEVQPEGRMQCHGTECSTHR